MRAAARVFLCRHGQTALNAQGAIRGRLDPPLDEVGLQEAEHLAQVLRRFHPDRVVSSPLRRAIETARPIAQATGKHLSIDPGFADRDYGPWAGQRADEIRARFGTLDDAPGVEAKNVVATRAYASLEIAADLGAVTVIVAHDAVNRLLISSFEPGRFADLDAIDQPTGCFNELERSNGKWHVVRVGVLPAHRA